MPITPQPLAKFNLADATILLLVGFQAEQDIYGQMLFGFGAKKFHRALTVAEGKKIVLHNELDLVVVEPRLPDGDGYAFVKWLRQEANGQPSHTPVVVITGHTPPAQVHSARDCGAHYVIRKPLSPEVLLQRILWITQEARPFIVAPGYVGPDRRFQNVGPPSGVGRRKDDLPVQVGEARDPNLDQNQVDELFRGRRGGAR